MPINEFTYNAFVSMVDLIRSNCYKICDYHSYGKAEKECILRHDVDMDIPRAHKMAKVEFDHGIKSTYFILLRTDFYNLYSADSLKLVKEIEGMGHEVGLHFDEVAYANEANSDTVARIIREIDIMSDMLGHRVLSVSMHRPSKMTLEANYTIEGIVNSYSEVFFKQFKYLSDSRMTWREDAESVIASQVYNKLHILTHPIWYGDKSGDARNRLLPFIKNAASERYEQINQNIRDLNSVIAKNEIERFDELPSLHV